MAVPVPLDTCKGVTHTQKTKHCLCQFNRLFCVKLVSIKYQLVWGNLCLTPDIAKSNEQWCLTVG